MNRLITVLLFCFVPFISNASIETYEFETAQQKQTYDELIFELRCLVCQNQNLADSNAELAQDLRKKVHTMLVAEKASKQEIIEFMVARYGDFVLYKPPVQNNTLLLWLGPFLLLLFAIGLTVRFVRQQKAIQETDHD